MGYNYAILGSGRQGTATAYDLAKFGEADLIIMADMDLEQAKRNSERVNKLIGKQICKPEHLNVKDLESVRTLLKSNKIHAAVSGVPYFFNLELTNVAIESGSCMVDYGGNTDVVLEQLKLTEKARKAGVTIIPDCGMAPGLANSLCAYTLELLDETQDLLTYDCGIPQNPVPPWNYILTFSIEGLTNEYYGKAHVLRHGDHYQTDCFEEYEELEFPAPIGKLEAFTTAGGASTMPWTYHGKLRTLQNKTMRWPGHFIQWKAFQNAGLFELEPVKVGEQMVVPRHLLHAVIDPKIRAGEGDKDMVIIRIIGRGKKDGKAAEAMLDLIDHFDEKTGFTAMERATGFHAGIMAYLAASGKAPHGSTAVEASVTPAVFLEEFNKRGFKLEKSFQYTEARQAVAAK